MLLAGTAAADGPPKAWRDLNHNGRLDPYEDSRQPVEARVDDLIAQMTLEEKVGTLLHGIDGQQVQLDVPEANAEGLALAPTDVHLA